MKPQDVLRRVAGTAVVLGGLGLALGGCVAVPAPGYYGYAAPYSSGYYNNYYNGAYYGDYAYPGYSYYGYGPSFYGVGIYGGCCRGGHSFLGMAGGMGMAGTAADTAAGMAMPRGTPRPIADRRQPGGRRQETGGGVKSAA